MIVEIKRTKFYAIVSWPKGVDLHCIKEIDCLMEDGFLPVGNAFLTHDFVSQTFYRLPKHHHHDHCDDDRHDPDKHEHHKEDHHHEHKDRDHCHDDDDCDPHNDDCSERRCGCVLHIFLKNIKHLEMAETIIHSLKAKGIYYNGDLVQLVAFDLLKIPGIDVFALNQIQEALTNVKLTLGMVITGWKRHKIIIDPNC